MKNKLKILHIISYSSRGGAEVFVENLIKSKLSFSEVHYVHLITFSFNIENLNLNIEKSSNFKHYHYYFPYKKLIINFIPIIIFFLKILFKNSYDIVNSHLLSPLYLFSFPLFFNKIKFIHTIHSQAEKELGRSKLSIYYIIRKIFYTNGSVVSISESVKKSVFSLYNLNSQLIYNGTEYKNKTNKPLSDFPSNYNLILLAVGNTRKVKNYQLLINAFKKNNDNAILIILGSLVEDFKNYDIESAKKDKIYFLGHVDNPQDYMKIANFLCMTSNYEGMPISILEAKANGLVPIVRPVEGILDVVKHKYNGIISDDLSVNSYLNALKEAFQISDNDKQNMINNAKAEFNEIYNMKICSSNYLNHYKKLYENK